MDDSTIICDEVIESWVKLSPKDNDAIPTNFNEKKVTCKTQSFYVLLVLLLITVALLISVST